MTILARGTVIILYLWHMGVASIGQAGTVYQWTDAQGHTQFSDTEPGGRSSITLELKPASSLPSTGLRPGERATLRAIEKRQQARHRVANTARRKQRHALEARRQACTDNRDQLRRGRHHVDSKAILKYLREHCW